MLSNTSQYKTAVLNLWAADFCLVGRDQGWELRIFNVSHAYRVSQSMKRYQVSVVELELPLHT